MRSRETLAQVLHQEHDHRETLRLERKRQFAAAKRQRAEEAAEAFGVADSGVNMPFYASGQGFVSSSLHIMLCQVL